MSTKVKVGLLVGVLLITAFAFAENGGQITAATVAVGQPATAAALPETPAAKPQPKPAAPAAKKSPLGITYGVDGRLRIDALNNMDLTNARNDESRFFRGRTRVFMNVNLGENVDGYVRLANEPFKRWYATNSAQKSVSIPIAGGDTWFSNAYLDFKKLPLKNTTLRIGRFDIARGDGFFLFAGVQGYGPKEGYFNGFDLAYTRGKHKFELIGTWNPRTDDFFPMINESYPSQPTINSSSVAFANDMGDEQAIGVYYTNRQFKNTDIDGAYFFFKQYNMTGKGPSDISWQPDRHMSLIHGRLVQRLPQHIIAHVNFTGEFGSQDAMTRAANLASIPAAGYPAVDIRAWGLNAFATKYFQVKTKPFLGVQAVALSGSDPKNPKVDGNFDLAMGRWAQTNHFGPFMEEGYAIPNILSDANVNNFTSELGVTPAYYSNYKSIAFRGGFTPLAGKVRKLILAADFKMAGAMNPFTANAAHYCQDSTNATCTFNTLLIGTRPTQFSTTGTHRWNAAQVEVRAQLTRSINAFVEYEKAWYGDYYNPTWVVAGTRAYRNNSNFFRAEINYRFSGFLPYKKAPKA